MVNPIEQFFDEQAKTWDDIECHTDEEKKNLLNQLNLKENDKVIDIACGTGVITRLIHEYTKSNVLGIDISNNMILKAKEKYSSESWAEFIHIDLMDLDEGNKFDCAIIYNAYPHFPSPEGLSKKLSKILNPNGKFAILHSLSRHQLSIHHAKRAKNVSRELKPIVEEAKYFENEFNILKAYEDDHSIVILGQLK